MSSYVFVRHARSVANAQGWFSGHVDVPLDPQGELEAAALAAQLADTRLERGFSSDLRRAVQTAEPVLGPRAVPLVCSSALRERSMGAWAGAAVASPPDGLHDVLHSVHLRPPGGESLLDVAVRALGFLAAVGDGPPALVVAHGGLLRVVLGMVDGMSWEALPSLQVVNATPMPRVVPAARWRELHALAVREAAAR